MICPRCGYDMENKNMCLRCGYRVTDIAPVKNTEDNSESEKSKQEEVETKVIDPCNVYLTHPYGVDDDEYLSTGFGGGFGSIFDVLFGDPFDIIGDIFGMGPRMRPHRQSYARQERQEDPPKKKRKQGPVVDVEPSEVEVIEDGEPKRSASEQPKTHREGEKKKNPFRHNRKRK